MRLVNLVNDRDEVIGYTDLLDAHRGKGKKHQAISWFLFRLDAEGRFELLMQQRSQAKIVGALQWANTLCANLIPEETHLSCLQRRSFEELGLFWQPTWSTKEVVTLNYQVACEPGFSENEVDHFFVTVLNTRQASDLQLSPNPQEVVDCRWLLWDEVKSHSFDKSMKIAPWTTLFLNTNQVIAAIDRELI